MIPAEVLRQIRNDLPMPVTIRNLGRDGPHSKMIEGVFRFVCPHCHEIRATVNPRNNLAHCFCCQKNINNIDLMISIGYDFKGAVRVLKQWLRDYSMNGPATSDPSRGKRRDDRQYRPMKLADFFSRISDNVEK